MATMGPLPGGFIAPIPDHLQPTMSLNQQFVPTSMNGSAEMDPNAEANRVANALKSRKRTKTGCLSEQDGATCLTLVD